MSEKIGSIYWDLDLDDKKFKKGIQSSSHDAKGFAAELKKAEKGSFLLLGGLTALTAGVVAYGISSIKSAGNMETMEQGFVTLLGSAEKARKIMARIKKEAAATPFTIPGLTKMTQMLTLVTKDGDKSIDILLNVGKALAAAGKGEAELERIVSNLQQISLTGKVTEMDLRQFGTSGVNIIELLAESMGITTKKVAELQDEGKITFKDLTTAFEKAGKEGGKFSKAFENQAGTLNQLWSNFTDNVNILGMELVKQTGIFDLVKEALDSVIDGMDTLIKDIEEAGGLTEYVNQKFKEFETWIYIIAGAITGALVPALVSLAASLLSTIAPVIPFILVGALLAAGIYKIIEALGGWDNIMATIKPKLEVIWNYIQTNIKPVLIEFANIIKSFLMPGLMALKNEIMTQLWPALQNLWLIVKTQLWPALKELWAIIGPVLIPILKILGIIIGGLILGLLYSFVEALRGAVMVMKFVINTVITWISVFRTLVAWIQNVINGFMILGSRIASALSGVKEAIIKPFREAFNWISEKVEGVKRTLDKINPFHRESPSLIDWIKKGTGEIKGLYGDMFNSLDSMSANGRAGMMESGKSMNSTMERSGERIAGGSSNVINMNGIMARSRGELRDIAMDLLDAINEVQKSKGLKPIGQSKLLGTTST